MKLNSLKKRLLLIFVFSVSSLPVQAQSSMQLELLGQVEIPYNYSFKETRVGGLSGLAYEPSTDTYYLISDDRSEFSDARFYSFRLKLNHEGKLEKGGIQFETVNFLEKRNEDVYKEGRIDPEGIAVSSDRFIFISSEGDPNINVAPFLNAYSKIGAFKRALTIPKAYWPAKQKNRQTSGVRENFGFEGLTISPDGSKLYAATENALLQDGPAADSINSSPSRLIIYDLPSGNILHEYAYEVLPVHIGSGEYGSFAVNGLTALMALNSNGHLLSLDRNYVAKQGVTIRLYEVTTAGATDIKGRGKMEEHKCDLKPVQKQLIADLGDYAITLDNFEGLALGPDLPEGGRLLLIVSDNNFSSDQKTLFTAFRLYNM